MERNILRFIATTFFFTLTLLFTNQCYSAEDENSPIIHIDQTEYTFPSALVGETLSHTFTVTNQGEADLNIRWRLKEVKPGYFYRLEVEDISQVGGDYVGHLAVQTDHSQMPELIIMIRGQISG